MRVFDRCKKLANSLKIAYRRCAYRLFTFSILFTAFSGESYLPLVPPSCTFPSASEREIEKIHEQLFLLCACFFFQLLWRRVLAALCGGAQLFVWPNRTAPILTHLLRRGLGFEFGSKSSLQPSRTHLTIKLQNSRSCARRCRCLFLFFSARLSRYDAALLLLLVFVVFVIRAPVRSGYRGHSRIGGLVFDPHNGWSH